MMEQVPEGAALFAVGAVTTKEEFRTETIKGIDSALNGLFSRFIGHDGRKLLNAQRRFWQEADDATVTKGFQDYCQEP